MPSSFAPETAVGSGTIEIPCDSPNVEPAFTVNGPPSWCRIVAFWAKEKWRLERLYGNELKSGTIELETLRLRDMN
jgi:hypothetical protein